MLHDKLNKKIHDRFKHPIVNRSIAVEKFKREEKLTRYNIAQQHVNGPKRFKWGVEFLLLALNKREDRSGCCEFV